VRDRAGCVRVGDDDGAAVKGAERDERGRARDPACACKSARNVSFPRRDHFRRVAVANFDLILCACRAQEMVGTVVYLVSPAGCYTNGQEILIDGGYLCVNPGTI
jgi:hypothetical protein